VPDAVSHENCAYCRTARICFWVGMLGNGLLIVVAIVMYIMGVR
jgi:hypothetical protein